MLNTLIALVLAAALPVTTFASTVQPDDLAEAVAVINMMQPRTHGKLNLYTIGAGAALTAGSAATVLFTWGSQAGVVAFAGIYAGLAVAAVGTALEVHRSVTQRSSGQVVMDQLNEILNSSPERQLALARENPALAQIFLGVAAQLRSNGFAAPLTMTEPGFGRR